MLFSVPPALPPQTATSTIVQTIPSVPFYSQFTDISSPSWKKVGCGIASLAMIVDYYSDTPVTVDTLLQQGIAAHAYSSAGWTYSGLIAVGNTYGLVGTTFDYGKSTASSALSELTDALVDGPVIASVHYKFEPTNPIPHLVVIDGIKGDTVYYNDPAAKSGSLTISKSAFLKAWKQRYIVLRPKKSVRTLTNAHDTTRMCAANISFA